MKIDRKKAEKYIRNYARVHYGPRRLQIRANGSVYLYSRRPNTNLTGLWLVGDMQQALDRFFGVGAYYLSA